MITTTLRLLRKHNACSERYTHLVAALCDGWADDATIPLLRILDTNGLDDALWAFRACEPVAECDRVARLFACDCAERALPIFERVRPNDNRPREAIRVARLFAHGEASAEKMVAAAAAMAAASDAAWAASDAAGAAAGAAEWASVWAAERAWQAKRLREMLEG